MEIIKKKVSADITVEHIKLLKAVAVILLMWHHLFGVVFSGTWLSPFKGLDVIVGISAHICIAIFLFCSGYGLYKSYIIKNAVEKTYTFKKAVKTLVPYWIIMMISIICLAILGKFEPKYIPNNLFCWVLDDNLYVSFAWYIKLYLVLMMILPLIRLLEKKRKKNIFIDLAIYIVLPVVIYYAFRKYMDETQFKNVFHSLVSSFLFLVYWFPLFAVGLLFAKYEIYTNIKKISIKIPKIIKVLVSLLTCGYVILFRYLFYFDNISDIIFAPLFIISCLLITDNIKFKSRYVIPYIGDKSLFYWLLSSMFFLNTAELQPLAYWPRIPVLILIWAIALLTPFVFCCDWLSRKILNLLFPNKS